ncbi:ATP-binding protein [Methanospirillum stamsii]|uniref:AAA-ATPase-like domain-containing protein n=1 Tax=Methanospirillum stamsii TaxID=1277351 RepID=A0A2V2N6H3_9EURY|nr:ATP-binding protein [Methanospirillum stamsii]PWR73326.1 hypothetical protein DLD82_10670 [Methanospirillum stamsii]
MSNLKLPIGIQSFVEMRTGGYVYVDKTPLLHSLIQSGKYYFLSRPRRFGKSLLIDTLHCAFLGRRDLFSGLFLDTPIAAWDWNRKNPVLKIDWSFSSPRSGDELKAGIDEFLTSWAREWKCFPHESSPGGRFAAIVRHIHAQTGQQVVILVDEYDKPILDVLNHPSKAAEMRDILRDFYGVIKPLDSHIRFVFLTGVSKFVRTGIFSGLNNLKDITLDSRYSSICGYTKEDLRKNFSSWYAEKNSELVREWYDGYSWTGESVYNPFDILLYFDSGLFKPYWFETGTPSFLISLWQANPRVPAEYEGLIASDDLLGSFDPDHIRLETLLFQAGYLTITSWRSNPEEGTWYTLGFPNREVKESFNRSILSLLKTDNEPLSNLDIRKILILGDIDGLHHKLQAFFASIPHDWYRNNSLSKFEGYWSGLVYSLMASLGFEVIPEDTTNRGRIDLTVKTSDFIWIFEFKVGLPEKTGIQNPLKQIQNRGYAEKYRKDSRKIIEIGIIFNPKTRNIDSWIVGS